MVFLSIDRSTKKGEKKNAREEEKEARCEERAKTLVSTHLRGVGLAVGLSVLLHLKAVELQATILPAASFLGQVPRVREWSSAGHAKGRQSPKVLLPLGVEAAPKLRGLNASVVEVGLRHPKYLLYHGDAKVGAVPEMRIDKLAVLVGSRPPTAVTRSVPLGELAWG